MIYVLSIPIYDCFYVGSTFFVTPFFVTFLCSTPRSTTNNFVDELFYHISSLVCVHCHHSIKPTGKNMNQTNQLRFFPRIFLLLFEYFTLYPCLPSQKKLVASPCFFTETEGSMAGKISGHRWHWCLRIGICWMDGIPGCQVRTWMERRLERWWKKFSKSKTGRFLFCKFYI